MQLRTRFAYHRIQNIYWTLIPHPPPIPVSNSSHGRKKCQSDLTSYHTDSHVQLRTRFAYHSGWIGDSNQWYAWLGWGFKPKGGTCGIEHVICDNGMPRTHTDSHVQTPYQVRVPQNPKYLLDPAHPPPSNSSLKFQPRENMCQSKSPHHATVICKSVMMVCQVPYGFACATPYQVRVPQNPRKNLGCSSLPPPIPVSNSSFGRICDTLDPHIIPR